MNKIKKNKTDAGDSLSNRFFGKRLYRNKNWLYMKYWIEGKSQPEIAKECGCYTRTIWRYMRDFGISARNNFDARKGKCVGKDHHMYGKHHTKETKRKMSKAKIGRTLPEEQKKRIGISLLGKKESKKHCEHISKGLKGKYIGEKASMYGKKHKPSTINKMSEARRLKWKNDEKYRNKMIEFASSDYMLQKRIEANMKRVKWTAMFPYYYGSSWGYRRRKALKRDNYSCRLCGSDEKLCVHHKVSVREHLRTMLDMLNLCDVEDSTNLLRIIPIGYIIPDVILEEAHRLENLITVCPEHHKLLEYNTNIDIGGVFGE